MNVFSRAYHSSLGKKYVMAVTGLLLFLFVIVHMAGNLQVFIGREPMNAYAAALASRPGLLWTARVGLLVIAVLHIVSALQLASENRAARPQPYAEGKPIASLASRTILVSGLIIFAFIIYHLMHFTLGVTNPDFVGSPRPARATRRLSNGGRGLSQPLCLGVLHRFDGAAVFASESRSVEPVPIARDQTKDDHVATINRFARWCCILWQLLIGNSLQFRLRFWSAGSCVEDGTRLPIGNPHVVTNSPVRFGELSSCNMKLDAKTPPGPLAEKWSRHRNHIKLVNPANKRKFDVIVVGSGLGRRFGRRDAGGTGLQGQMLLFSGQPAPRALHRRAGRHQRREELSERRRQRLSPCSTTRSKAATSAPAKRTSIGSPKSA